MQLRDWRWLLATALFFVIGCQPQIEQASIEGRTMGTTYNISWVQPEMPVQKLALQAEVDMRLEQINDSMSTWRKDSLISEFNAHHSVDPLEVDLDFATVMAEAIRLHQVSGGALDVTIGPLVNLWGFGPNGRRTEAPSDAELEAVRQQVGLDLVAFDGRSVKKRQPELYLDFSSIAKGYGVDVVADVLEKRGITNYLVEVGGELRVRGQKADGSLWRIAVERPDPEGRHVFSVIEPGDMAMATSGDYRNFFESKGRRFSHLIDPRVGEPVSSALVSATVLAPKAMTADGLATAMIVLGTEEALALAKEQNLPVMLIERQLEDFAVFYSPAFEPYVKEQTQ